MNNWYEKNSNDFIFLKKENSKQKYKEIHVKVSGYGINITFTQFEAKVEMET